MSIKVHWVGALGDSSGYASASRNYVRMLMNYKDIDLSIDQVSFEREKTGHHLIGEFSGLIKPDPGARIRIVHLTPENYIRFRNPRPGVYNIGYTTWEAEPIPGMWVDLCNLMNEIWVPSQWNIGVFQRSGVTKPIHCVPHGFKKMNSDPSQKFPEYSDKYWFYSIFQWTERKNPFALLTAYFTEFQRDSDNVVLAIKAYRKGSSQTERNIIKADIDSTKSVLNLSKYPPILFIGKLLSDDEMLMLHNTGSCFVSPTRAEGFGINLADAMLHGKPTIGPRYGGSIDFMNDENSLLVDSRDCPVFGMEWMTHYTGEMKWGDPSIMDLRSKMRWCYEHQEEARQIGLKGQQTIETKFSWDVIGKLMFDRITEIASKLGL